MCDGCWICYAIVAVTLGSEHPEVATILGNLGETAGKQGRNQEAERLMVRAIAILERRFGSRHPAVVNTYGTCVKFLVACKRMTEARAITGRLKR